MLTDFETWLNLQNIAPDAVVDGLTGQNRTPCRGYYMSHGNAQKAAAWLKSHSATCVG
jgi:hypothetical protein